MPLTLHYSHRARLDLDTIRITCQYCKKILDEYIDWDGVCRDSMKYYYEDKLDKHEYHCIDNPDNIRTCEECDNFTCWFEEDCMVDNENFETRNAKTCKQWSRGCL